jgi:hypothetical protein
MKESVDKRGLGNTQQACSRRSWLGACFPRRAVVFVEQLGALDLFPVDKPVSPGVGNSDAAQHLANDDLNVLVVDLHALQTIDILHFINNIAGQGFHAQRRRMSCGSAGPSTISSPLFTIWPSWTSTCFSFEIRVSCCTPSISVMTRRCLPLVSLPNETVPVTSASMPASFGERASKSSATREDRR